MTLLELAKILDAIDRFQTFEAAANHLHKVRSALTYTIRKFENQHDIQIFDRSQHRVQWTAAGKALLERGRQLLLSEHHALNLAKQIASGWETDIYIAYDELVNVSPILMLLKKFQQTSPDINIHLEAHRLNGCLDTLLHHRADIVIGLSGQIPISSDLCYFEIGKVSFIFAISPSHPLANVTRPISTDMIEQYTTINASDSSLRMAPRATGIQSSKNSITFSSLALKKQAQIEGLGVGFLPKHLISKELDNQVLIQKEVIQEKQSAKYYIAWRKASLGKGVTWLLEQMKKEHFIIQLFAE